MHTLVGGTGVENQKVDFESLFVASGSSSTSKPEVGHVSGNTCNTWQHAVGMFQAIQGGLQQNLMQDRQVGVLQSCVLLCSSLTRSVTNALAEALGVETSVTMPPQATALQVPASEVRPLRKRLQGKQPDPMPAEEEDTGEVPKPPKGIPLHPRFSWKCNLCNFAFSANTYGSWSSKKSRHIDKFHKDGKHLIADRRSIYPIIEASEVPGNARHWTCAYCGLGLPWLPSSQLTRSRDAHLEKCAPGKTAQDNWQELRHGNEDDQVEYRIATRKKAGWHSEVWQRERTQQAKEQGHALVSFMPTTGLLKAQHFRYTCCHCKRLQAETDCFTRKKCIPKATPKTSTWRRVRLECDAFMGNLMQIWGWGQQEVKKMDQKTNGDLLRGLDKKLNREKNKVPQVYNKPWFKALPVQGTNAIPPQKGRTWLRDLTEEGVEPNPGPRVKKRMDSKIQLMGLNANGKENLWMAGPQISPKESDVVCFQETCMSSHESKVFGNAMWKRGWVTYFLPFGQNRCSDSGSKGALQSNCFQA